MPNRKALKNALVTIDLDGDRGNRWRRVFMVFARSEGLSLLDPSLWPPKSCKCGEFFESMGPANLDRTFRIDAGRVGVSQITPSGYLQCYIRLAAANRPMFYQSGNGTGHEEIIPPDELFRVDSAATFKSLPITLRHPEDRRVTPKNARQLTVGATGQSILRENTPHGEFLGMSATFFGEDAITAINNGWQISPGYDARAVLRSDGKYEQRDRVGNHVAVVSKARGGDDITPLLEGLRVDEGDSANILYQLDREPELWIVHEDELPAIHRLFSSEPGTIAMDTGGSINLDGKFKLFQKGESPKAADDKGLDDSNDSDEPEEKPPRTLKKKASSASACSGKNCSDKTCDCKGKKKKMASVKIDGVDYEFESDDLARVVASVVARADSADGTTDRVAQLEAQLEATQNDYRVLAEHAGTILEELEELEEASSVRTDSDDSALSEEELLGQIVSAVEAVESIRADGALLVDMGFIPDFRVDTVDLICDTSAYRKQILSHVSPTVRCDEWDDAEINAAYSVALATLRAQHAAQPANSRRASGRIQPGSQGANRNDGMGSMGSGTALSLQDMVALSSGGSAAARARDAIAAAVSSLNEADDASFQTVEADLTRTARMPSPLTGIQFA